MSTTTLKIIALVCMLIDHIAQYIPSTPEWFHWIGRLAAPVFFFCMAWGFYYTRNRKRYLIRMYLFGLSMALLNFIINYLQNRIYVTNDIFMTLFLSGIIIEIIETYRENPSKGRKYIFFFITIQIFSTAMLIIGDLLDINFSIQLLSTLLGNVFIAEGNIPFIILGVLLYYVRDSKKNLTISYICFSICFSILYVTNIAARILLRLEYILPNSIYNIMYNSIQIIGIEARPINGTRYFQFTDYRWMLILALPLILLYNGKKGKGFKYFFYFFYPIHIYLLIILRLLIFTS